MRLHDLQPNPGSHRDRKRLGRGTGSGQGTTAGKGTKGQKARSGGMKAGFRGMSSRNFRLAHRRGFTNIFRVEYQPVNLNRLSGLSAGDTVTIDTLLAMGLVHTKNGRPALAKILGEGEISVPLTFVGLKVSAGARQKIEQAGGMVTDGETAQES